MVEKLVDMFKKDCGEKMPMDGYEVEDFKKVTLVVKSSDSELVICGKCKNEMTIKKGTKYIKLICDKCKNIIVDVKPVEIFRINTFEVEKCYVSGDNFVFEIVDGSKMYSRIASL